MKNMAPMLFLLFLLATPMVLAEIDFDSDLTPEEEEQTKEAVEACPVEAIGDDGE